MPGPRLSAALLLVGSLARLLGAAEPQFRFPDQNVDPGASQIAVPLLVTHDSEILGVQIYGFHDPSVLRLVEISLQETIFENRDVTFLSANGPPFQAAVLPGLRLDVDHVIPPGEDQISLRLVFELAPGAPVPSTTQVRFEPDAPRFLENGVYVGDNLVLATTRDATIEIGAVQSGRFLRGDADGNGLLDITDPIRTLSYLFLGAEQPPCLDAADVFDRGVVDISAPIAALGFLFNGGPPPAPPFPEAGSDPTPDTLPPCEDG